MRKKAKPATFTPYMDQMSLICTGSRAADVFGSLSDAEAHRYNALLARMADRSRHARRRADKARYDARARAAA